MIQVLVVDDDALTLELHGQYVGRLDGFEVSGLCAGASAALRALIGPAPRPVVDLVLLDMTMPDGSGLDVLRRIRAAGSTVDVIAVTSVRDAETVRATASLGVVQYLVKPFTFGVFRERLEQYAQARELRAPRGPATQAEIDALLGAGRTAPIPVTPKGISPDTLDAVGRALRKGDALSAVETARLLGLSRVSARRYLEHLVEIGAAERRARHGRPGRPESEYRWSV
ncbi:response regulator [Microbacterium sp. SORGH_AS_0862]|uniref:response regulator n=1 Tax=Microbacterium sp. SORGH_AS_0862 TaxID=3041789 RepID=UPI00278FB786|nr:response regulator [Microbacterium sp. SORGH_AS_0862]MDQ1204037.1 response regulator of citrate/malate metabolism [Microbacterium sp. SORGH_AS_0862]